ncbi:alpha-D-xyloside xylohydrolase [Hydrogenispora ethanolica]|uniref:Alpha-D-xyloside xylohydrolase n=1 Tax=Hydrogenispora ethanolica TaxID=1082276 RepID=A0A4V2QCV6_HYDET|nr:TIM-barrel domain-containing protein [Hydrogenispora ethanolica]TCL61927.1 alpha-D-xyloside xylohydrolase [Hydrogenispora ethanolica]
MSNQTSANEAKYGPLKWTKNAAAVQNQKGGIFVNVAKFPKITELKEVAFLLAQRVKSYRREQNAVAFQVEGKFYRQAPQYRYLDFRPMHDELPNTRNLCVRLSFLNDDVVRIQLAEGMAVPENRTEMIGDCQYEPVQLAVVEDAAEVVISTRRITVRIHKEPWNLTISDCAGKIFYKQFSGDEHSFMKYEVCPFGFLYDRDHQEKFSCEGVYFDDAEHFYGFGEKFGALDKKGQTLNLWNANAMGTNTERSYKNIPFFISSRGYGVFYNTSYKLNCDMGNSLYKAYSIMSGDPALDFFVIHGPSIKEILPRYTAITGKPVMPPKWSFGLWMSKISYGSREEVEGVAKKLRERQIPCDVIHIDTDWFDESWVCNWKFSEKRFPKVAEMIADLSRDGFKISLWQLPYVEKGNLTVNDVYEEGMAKGYFACAGDGELEFPHGLIDFSNPEAVDWYQHKLLQPLLELGIKAIKVDFGESAPASYTYQNCDGKAMHNLYALLYNKAAYEATAEVYGEEDAVIWARSTWAGSQKYPVHWGGDAGTDFHGLASSIKGGLGFGLSGFPFWSHDIGGFWFDTNPVLFARWTQVGMFSSHARTHGFFTREPWDFGPEVEAIFKKYTELRYRLIPYIYSSARQCVAESLPLFRALVLEYQDDPAVAGIDSQYLFGESFLVAPILNEENVRSIYLPEGIWTDYWDGTQYQGKQWLTYEAGLDKLPLFVRANAIIPMGPLMNYIDERECDPITLDLYPVGGQSRFGIVDTDQNRIQVTLQADESIRVTVSPSEHHFLLELHNTGAVTGVTVNGAPVPVAANDPQAPCHRNGRGLTIRAEGQSDRELVIVVQKA